MSDTTADWRPTATRDALLLRARLYALVREFMHERGVLEVETPILSEAGNTDANIESFRLEFDGHRDAGARTRWLRTSPEFPLKRLLAAGIGDCYELGRVFRNGEAGRRHNPEFTMLEWYRVGWDHHRLMDETAELVQAALGLVGRRASVRETSYRMLYQDLFGFDPHDAPIDALREPLQIFDIPPEGLTRDDWLDLLMTHLVQPTLTENRILLVHGYPATQAALARLSADAVPVAERFELYLGPLELANGYHELRDAREQGARFAADNARRAARGAVQPPPDARLLDALGHGLPSCAGVAMGMDRLMMCLLGTERIDEVLAFPFPRA